MLRHDRDFEGEKFYRLTAQTPTAGYKTGLTHTTERGRAGNARVGGAVRPHGRKGGEDEQGTHTAQQKPGVAMTPGFSASHAN